MGSGFKGLVLVAATLTILAGCGKGDPGSQGPKGDKGDTGEKGDKGDDGSDGSPGPKGEDGSSVSVVRFCSGVTPTYPAVFPEVGICVAGSIYAVFNPVDKTDYLAEIPPGLYASSATGASCTFVVEDGCVVSGRDD